MAVTVLRHMKESKGSNKAAHLQHAIHYIMNPEKTEGGLWTGSNCGIMKRNLSDHDRYKKSVWKRMGQTKLSFCNHFLRMKMWMRKLCMNLENSFARNI